MAKKIPVKARFSGMDVVALGEFEPSDTTDPLFHENYGGYADYANDIDFAPGTRCEGSDGNIHECVIANGPSSSVVDPVGDVSGTWKIYFTTYNDVKTDVINLASANGNCAIAQEGDGPFVGSLYTLDHWRQSTGNSDVTVNRESLTTAESLILEATQHAVAVTKTTSFSSPVGFIRYDIGKPQEVNNKKVTVSFNINTQGVTGTLYHKLDVRINGNIEHSTSPLNTIADTGGAWVEITKTFDLPDFVSGNTLTNDDLIAFMLVGDATTDFTKIRITNLRIQPDTNELIRTPFPTPAAQLAECQEWFWAYPSSISSHMGHGFVEGGSTTDTIGTIVFPVSMRVPPAVSCPFADVELIDGAVHALTALTFAAPTTEGVRFEAVSSSLTSYSAVILRPKVNAPTLLADSRIY